MLCMWITVVSYLIVVMSLFSFIVVLLYFNDPRVWKIKNEASSCPGIFSRTFRFYSPPFLIMPRASSVSLGKHL